MDIGGSAAPFGLTPYEGPPQARDSWNVVDFFEHNITRLMLFTKQLDDRAKETLERACLRAGTATTEVSRIVLTSDNAAAMKALADRLNFPIARTNFDIAQEVGHFGAADFLFCLSQYSVPGDLAPGSRIALLSRGRGMHWACTLLEV
jgi:3-oxoacyl-[acyl-carrier-protein] synthase-3